MTDKPVLLASDFESASGEDWLEIVTRSLKGGGLDRLVCRTRDAIAIKPLYQDRDFPAGKNPRGMPGMAPWLRGGHAEPDPFRAWDIRQGFSCPDPGMTNTQILHDLENGVGSSELSVDSTGMHGVQLCDLAAFEKALDGVRPDLAPVALDHQDGDGHDVRVAALLALWAKTHDTPQSLALAFNLDPFSALVRTGRQAGGLQAAFAQTVALIKAVGPVFPASTLLRVDARPAHEAGASEALELGVLMAHAVDTLRRLQIAGIAIGQAASQIVFTMAVDANYGIGMAKLRAARRLWARVQEVLDIDPVPMRLQAVTSMRMLTRYDPWVNMLRATAACFAAVAGGADIISVRAFNQVHGPPESLGRRIARNTQIIAMEESGLGRVADPAGGAWFTETLGEDLAAAGWRQFQAIEAEGGYGNSLVAGRVQARIAAARDTLLDLVRKRVVEITGINTFPLLDEVDVPQARTVPVRAAGGIDPQGLHAFKIAPVSLQDEKAFGIAAEPLPAIHVAAPFEVLRDRAEAHFAATGCRPTVFLVTLGPLSEHGVRAGFAVNFLAAGGIVAKKVPAAGDEASCAATFKDHTGTIAILCGSDEHYARMAGTLVHTLKKAGAGHVWIVGDFMPEGVDGHIRHGGDIVACLETLHATLGVKVDVQEQNTLANT